MITLLDIYEIRYGDMFLDVGRSEMGDMIRNSDGKWQKNHIGWETNHKFNRSQNQTKPTLNISTIFLPWRLRNKF